MDDNLPEPYVTFAVRGDDADKVGDTREARNIVQVIPMRTPRKLRRAVDRKLYRLCNLAERSFNELENARRVAIRCVKTVQGFLG
jgi:hypothetical protein